MEIPEHILRQSLRELGSHSEQDEISGCEVDESIPALEKLAPEDEEFDPLFNASAPQWNAKWEKFKHRQLAWLIASGCTQKEAAVRVGYSQVHTGNVCRQPYFQKLVLKEITRTGRNAVDELIKNAAPNSVLKLIELRDTSASPTVQFNASKELLNRYLGNTTTVIRHEESELPADPVAAVEALKHELAGRR